MTFPSLSDFASAVRLQNNTSFLRGELVRASEELTTGRAQDIREQTQGSYNPVFAIDRSLARIEQRQIDLADAEGRSGVAQSALDRLQTLGQNLGDPLAAAVARDDLLSAEILMSEADGELAAATSTLSIRFGSRYVFSGAAEDRPPFAGSEQILADVRALVIAAPTAAQAVADIDDYFNAAGGTFETAIYEGSTQDGPPVPLDDITDRPYLIRADATEIRAVLQGFAMAAAYDPNAFGGNRAELKAYLSAAATQVTDANDALVGLRATLGASEELIDQARTAAVAEANALDLARFDLVGVDQYEASARFVSLQAQLDTLYNVTARLSNLRFVNYIR